MAPQEQQAASGLLDLEQDDDGESAAGGGDRTRQPGLVVACNRPLDSATHDGSGEPASVPGLLGAHLAIQDGPPPGPPGPPSLAHASNVNDYDNYDDCSDDHERDFQEACESWAPHDRMLKLIDQKVVFHGKVVGCSPYSKTLDVEIWEYGATAMTKYAEAVLEVPLRMVINALEDR